MDIDWGAVRVRATSYVTKIVAGQPQLLVFDYPSRPDEPAVLPGGGIEAGERPDEAAIREVIEETGIDPRLDMQGVVGIQQGTYDTGLPCINIFFHLNASEQRTQWTHQMIGDPNAWDTGLDVRVRFEPLAAAAERLRHAAHKQEAFIECLSFDGIRRSKTWRCRFPRAGLPTWQQVPSRHRMWAGIAAVSDVNTLIDTFVNRGT